MWTLISPPGEARCQVELVGDTLGEVVEELAKLRVVPAGFVDAGAIPGAVDAQGVVV